ncbi:MAG: hypothetical protein IAF94_26935 [Pirellulaceae bacterium]|nr:hypothetical protein [Pirellulaceae bacterium]
MFFITFVTILLSTDQPFEIQILDDQSGRGVPLVELSTTAEVTYVTDSAGRIAFDEPGMMDQRVWFAMKSHGYEPPKDGFGIAGAAFDVKPGGKAAIKIKRLNIAERLYRITGSGIYRDSVLLGRQVPIKEPLLNGKVTGCDSVLLANYQTKLYWFWGDTNRPAYILGLFDVPGATSALPGEAGLDIEKGIDFNYFTGKDGFARATCKMAGEGPTWIGGVTVVKDAKGKERLMGSYFKVKPPLSIYRRGTCIWNDEKNEFEHAAAIPLEAPLHPHGHPILFNDCGVLFVYFGDPFFNCRTYATVEGFSDLTKYEAFTCLKAGSSLDKPVVERDASGNVVWAFKRNTPPIDAAGEEKLLAADLLKKEEANFQIHDGKTGQKIAVHRGSVRWNEYRKKWVCLFGQYGGSSFIGEIWYAEANGPTGPWKDAVKVVTHDKYSFYNPVHHAEFDREGGRSIYFEGTYTTTFSGNDHKTPRYDYNQVLYKLDLADVRLRSK